MSETFKRIASNPGALVNTDQAGLESYKKQKASFARINSLEDRLEDLEKMARETNVLLKAMLEKFS